MKGPVNIPCSPLVLSLVETLALLTESECQQLLVEWNQTAVEYPCDQCIHELFEIQTEQTPEAEAVVFARR